MFEIFLRKSSLVVEFPLSRTLKCSSYYIIAYRQSVVFHWPEGSCWGLDWKIYLFGIRVDTRKYISLESALANTLNSSEYVAISHDEIPVFCSVFKPSGICIVPFFTYFGVLFIADSWTTLLFRGKYHQNGLDFFYFFRNQLLLQPPHLPLLELWSILYLLIVVCVSSKQSAVAFPLRHCQVPSGHISSWNHTTSCLNS